MFVLMNTTMSASPNGYDTKLFEEGEVYEVSEDLGGVMIREEWADEAEPEIPTLVEGQGGSSGPGGKDGGGAPENKDLGGPANNKIAGMVLMKSNEGMDIKDPKTKKTTGEKKFEKGKKYKVPEDMPEAVAASYLERDAAEIVEGGDGFMDRMLSKFKG